MGAAVVIQHHPVEGPTGIAQALERRGIATDVVRVDLCESVPAEVSDAAALVVMGGPMSATSDDAYPTRRAELALLRDALDRSVPVLGVCLGAQLLALAAGGEVVAGDGPEIGWAPIELSAHAAADPLLGGLPESVDVLHWHGETYTLPSGAVHLARSARYEQQAFRVGANAWGFQFHLEVDEAAVVAFVDAFPRDAGRAPGGRAELLAATADAVQRAAPHRDVVLDRFAGLAAERT